MGGTQFNPESRRVRETGRERISNRDFKNSAAHRSPVPHVFFQTKKPSSFPAKLGMAILHTNCQLGISFSNHSSTVQSLNPVYLLAFWVPTTTIVSPRYAWTTLFVKVPAVIMYTISKILPFPPACLFRYSTPSLLTVSEIHIVRYSLAILSTATTLSFIRRSMYVQ